MVRGVFVQGRKGTSVSLRSERLNHKQRVAHNNKQYNSVCDDDDVALGWIVNWMPLLSAAVADE